MMQKIRFQGKEYLLLDGVIATEEQYRKGEISFAFLKGNNVLRFNEIIGSRDDIEFIGEIEDIKPDPDAYLKMLDWQVNSFENLSMMAIARKIRNSKGNGGTVKFRRYAAPGDA